jgi:hypothetical protein
MEPDGCFDASGLTAAEVGDGDSAALAVVLPQPASARPMSTARR